MLGIRQEEVQPEQPQDEEEQEEEVEPEQQQNQPPREATNNQHNQQLRHDPLPVHGEIDPPPLESFETEEQLEFEDDDEDDDGAGEKDEDFELDSVMGEYLKAIQAQIIKELKKEGGTLQTLLPILRQNDFWIRSPFSG